MTRSIRRSGAVLTAACLVIALAATHSAPAAGARSAEAFDRGYAMVFVGAGATHPHFGDTETNVETVDLIGRYTWLKKRTGRGRWRGSHEFFLETAVQSIHEPVTSAMFSLAFLGSLTWDVGRSFRPYWFAGGGPLYTEADIPDTSAIWKGNYQTGLGLRWRLGEAWWLATEYRLHHVSNGGYEKPNQPLNSSKVLLGIGWTR
jgi:opacity protein-like surface antigen